MKRSVESKTLLLLFVPPTKGAGEELFMYMGFDLYECYSEDEEYLRNRIEESGMNLDFISNKSLNNVYYVEKNKSLCIYLKDEIVYRTRYSEERSEIIYETTYWIDINDNLIRKSEGDIDSEGNQIYSYHIYYKGRWVFLGTGKTCPNYSIDNGEIVVSGLHTQKKEKPGEGAAVVSLALGITSITFLAPGVISFFAFIMGMIAIICSMQAKKVGYCNGIQKAGFISGLIGIIKALLIFIIF